MRKSFFLAIICFCSLHLYCQNDREIFINNKKYWEEKITEQNGFKWSLIHEITNNKRLGYDKENFRGALVNGEIVVPCEFASIHYKFADEKDKGCFVVTKYYLGDYCYGAYTTSGHCIIDPDSENFWSIERVRDKDLGVINEVHHYSFVFYITILR